MIKDKFLLGLLFSFFVLMILFEYNLRLNVFLIDIYFFIFKKEKNF